MSSHHSALIASGPSETGAFYADCAGRRGFDAASTSLGRTQSKVAAQNDPPTGQTKSILESDIRIEERCRERARIAHELHDTLLQGFLGASMLLGQAVKQTPADSPSKPALNTALRLIRRAVDEGRAAILGIPTASPAPLSLEQGFSNLLSEVTTGQGVRFRVFVQGEPRALDSGIQEQLFLIGREAVVNALRHSNATNIEVEIQYLPTLLRVSICDNGCGMNPEAVQRAGDSHWGLRGMRERAENIGARFRIWSRPGKGTEVRVAVPVGVAKRITDDSGSREGRSEI
jgi:signal transduction histidine kinase